MAAEQRRTRDLEVALAEKNAVAEASRTRVDEILRDYERQKSEMRTLQDSLAARDTTIVKCALSSTSAIPSSQHCDRNMRK